MNKLKSNQSREERTERILEMIVRFTQGHYDKRETVSDEGDDLDAIVIGLNTLGEELQASGTVIRDYHVRIQNIMDNMLNYTLGDFSHPIRVSDIGDELDAIAIGLNTMADEITAAKEVQQLQMEQITEANNELEAFTYSVSHDLRAPLRAIHGYTSILEEEYMDKFDEEGKRMMSSVIRNAKKMGQLIDDLLTLSRLGKKELSKRNTNLTDLVNQCLNDIKMSTDVSKATITIDELGTAYVDPALMFQVFCNLLSNAIKYSSAKDHPVIHVGVERNSNESIYFVRDNGSGFDMKYYDKLFGVFQRLHSMEEFEGTGVGLALVKRVVTRHHGKVWAEGRLNEGATFYVSLKTNEN